VSGAAQLLQWAGSAGGAALIVQLTAVALRRMNRRQVNAETRKADAEAAAKLEDAESTQAQALVTVGQYLQVTMAAAAADADRTRRKLQAALELHDEHISWDQEMTAAARARGEAPRPAPPLWPSE
jgi:hypothetical protein